MSYSTSDTQNKTLTFILIYTKRNDRFAFQNELCSDTFKQKTRQYDRTVLTAL